MDVYIVMFEAAAKPLLMCVLLGTFLLGVLALTSPQAFKRVVAISNYWVDTRKMLRIPNNKLLHLTDRWVDTDRYFMPYVRVMGIVALLGAALLSFIYSSV